MPVLDDFKKDLKTAITNFEVGEKNITMEMAKGIISLKLIIDTADSACILRQQLEVRLETLDGKWYAFLPLIAIFVTDLRKDIWTVLNKSKYKFERLLTEEYHDLRNENRDLKNENNELKVKFAKFIEEGFADAQSFIEKLQREKAELQKQLEAQLKEHLQEASISNKEKELLRSRITELEQKNRELERQFKESEKQKQQLHIESIKGFDRIQQLEKTIRVQEELQSSAALKTPITFQNDYTACAPVTRYASLYTF